ncbi:hypothetical protein [Fuscibacter oryzae]|uniref:Uncharacterized protein n=1 Tax=Fuscibacter oryzae TaxID=2803939 RepID=A0A8J7MTP1_9RHOB|nr:hypothetical protein [Fuscibacter oryzae]MBL4929968.1 hypothetical protein [Fuscibacter oryzae]
MPKLVALYIRSVAIGFAISAVFLTVLVGLNVAGLRGLIMGSSSGWIAGAMLFMSNGIIFAGVQFGIAVMGMAEPPEGPRGGNKAPVTLATLSPIRLESRIPSRRR